MSEDMLKDSWKPKGPISKKIEDRLQKAGKRFHSNDNISEFIEKLLDAGYKGESNEQIVDGWFRTIAQNILQEEGLDPTRGAGYINTKNLSDDKSEIS